MELAGDERGRSEDADADRAADGDGDAEPDAQDAQQVAGTRAARGDPRQGERDYTRMKHQRLGSTGVKVSRLGLGCGNFGGVGSAPAFFGMGENEAQAHALLDRAREAGINLLDTADAYGGGRSESFIGSWLAARGSSVRDPLVISTKVFNPVGPGPNERGLSRLHIQR
ncbi:MAG: aldo/keto reductase, partial [Solirubrobacteraceae bacterium]